MQEGDLDGYLKNQNGELLSEDTVLLKFVQICLGLQHVHSKAGFRSHWTCLATPTPGPPSRPTPPRLLSGTTYRRAQTGGCSERKWHTCGGPS